MWNVNDCVDSGSFLKETTAKNKGYAKEAAKTAFGKVVLKQFKDQLRKKAPMMVRGYISDDNPLSDLVIAVLFDAAVSRFAPGNEKASVIADCLMTSAYMNSGDFAADMVNGLIAGIELPELPKEVE